MFGSTQVASATPFLADIAMSDPSSKANEIPCGTSLRRYKPSMFHSSAESMTKAFCVVVASPMLACSGYG